MNIIKEIQAIHAKLDSLIEKNNQKEKEMTDITALETELNNALDLITKSKNIIATLETSVNTKKAEVEAAVQSAVSTVESQVKVDTLTEKVKHVFAEFRDYVASKEAAIVYEAEALIDRVEGKPVPVDPRAPIQEPIPVIG